MPENKKLRTLCFKVPSAKSRCELQRRIDLIKFKGAYGTKSCNCACSCTDGY